MSGRYKFIEKIGYGRFSDVWRCYDSSGNKYVSVKKFVTCDWQGNNETTMLYRLRHVDGIPKYYSSFIDKTGAFNIVMEYIDGFDLLDIINSICVPSIVQSKIMFLELCRIVKIVHDKNIVHRDIKPENIRVQADGSVWLIDWGMAITVNQEDVFSKQLCGTHGYAAPEAYEGVVCKSNDIWALGIVLYTMLAGDLPFTSQQTQVEETKSFKLKMSYTIPLGARRLLKKIFVPYDYRPTIDDLIGDKWLNSSATDTHFVLRSAKDIEHRYTM